MRCTTLNAIADRVGVSHRTVATVDHGRDEEKLRTRNALLSAENELDDQPSHPVRAPDQAKTMNVAFVSSVWGDVADCSVGLVPSGRTAGGTQGLASVGLPVKPALMRHADSSLEGARTALRGLLEQRRKRPSSVTGFDDSGFFLRR